MHGNTGSRLNDRPAATLDSHIMTVYLSTGGYLSSHKYRVAFLTSFFFQNSMINRTQAACTQPFFTHKITNSDTRNRTHWKQLLRGNVCCYNCDFLHCTALVCYGACLCASCRQEAQCNTRRMRCRKQARMWVHCLGVTGEHSLCFVRLQTLCSDE